MDISISINNIHDYLKSKSDYLLYVDKYGNISKLSNKHFSDKIKNLWYSVIGKYKFNIGDELSSIYSGVLKKTYGLKNKENLNLGPKTESKLKSFEIVIKKYVITGVRLSEFLT